MVERITKYDFVQSPQIYAEKQQKNVSDAAKDLRIAVKSAIAQSIDRGNRDVDRLLPMIEVNSEPRQQLMSERLPVGTVPYYEMGHSDYALFIEENGMTVRRHIAPNGRLILPMYEVGVNYNLESQSMIEDPELVEAISQTFTASENSQFQMLRDHSDNDEIIQGIVPYRDLTASFFTDPHSRYHFRISYLVAMCIFLRRT